MNSKTALSHPEKIIVESEKILIKCDFVFKKVDPLESQKNKIQIFQVDPKILSSFFNFLSVFPNEFKAS